MILVQHPTVAEVFESQVFKSGNIRGLALFSRKPMEVLRRRTKEMTMDSTYGTNHLGPTLFAVLAEVDGTGIPLAYCFVDKLASADGTMRRAQPGSLTDVFAQFLDHIRQAGFRPTFFGTDKGLSEIAAVKQVWGQDGVTPQLCYWHAKRALRMKLKDSSISNTQLHYFPKTARSIVPGIEICWGSLPIRRPKEEDHMRQGCQCPSRKEIYSEKGRIEKLSATGKDTILQIFRQHFNSHALIPDRNGSFCAPEVIHRESTAEMYSWCRERNYFRLWVYLFVNWYCSEQWSLWARSSNAVQVPVLKTTMIVESHWRRLKHDYLHRFNRPRIDLVTWILAKRVIPEATEKMKGLIEGNHRMATAAWRKPFKRQWKALQDKEVNPDSLLRYYTAPMKWVCACEAFLESRFLLCKHLTHCLERFSNPSAFFREVRRRRTSPFWEHLQMVVRVEFKSIESPQGIDIESDDFQIVRAWNPRMSSNMRLKASPKMRPIPLNTAKPAATGPNELYPWLVSKPARATKLL